MNASPNSLSAQASGARFADHAHAPFLELRSIAKSFGSVEAIRNVSLTLRSGASTQSSAKTVPGSRP